MAAPVPTWRSDESGRENRARRDSRPPRGRSDWRAIGQGPRGGTKHAKAVTNDLSTYSSTLSQGPDGIWYGGRVETVSYPDGGNAACLAVEDGSFWFQHRNRCICAALKRFPPPGPIFDIGGGNGFVSLALAAAGHDVVLVEPGVNGARAGHQRGLPAVACASLHAAGFHPGSLPAVGLFDVVEHVDDDLSFMRQVAAAMAPSGRAYLTVPAYTWLWSGEDDAAGHKRRYTQGSLAQVVERAGFEIEYASYFFRWLPLPILLLRTVPGRLGLGRRAPSVARAREHAGGPGVLRRVVDASLQGEVGAIESGRRLAFGGSVLLVARLGTRCEAGPGRTLS